METSRTNAQYKRNDRYNVLYEIEWILSDLWNFFRTTDTTDTTIRKPGLRKTAGHGLKMTKCPTVLSLKEFWETLGISELTTNTLNRFEWGFWSRSLTSYFWQLVYVIMSQKFSSVTIKERFFTNSDISSSTKSTSIYSSKQTSVRRKKNELSAVCQTFLTSNNMIFLLQFGISKHL